MDGFNLNQKIQTIEQATKIAKEFLATQGFLLFFFMNASEEEDFFYIELSVLGKWYTLKVDKRSLLKNVFRQII